MAPTPTWLPNIDPNAVTIAGTPFAALACFTLLANYYAASAAFVLLMMACDFFDGQIARAHNRVSLLGKILDPFVDSITHIALLLAYTAYLDVNVHAFLYVVIARDALSGFLRQAASLSKAEVASRLSGKLKTATRIIFILMMAVLLAIFGPVEWVCTTFLLGFIVVAATALFSGIDYAVANTHVLVALWRNTATRI